MSQNRWVREVTPADAGAAGGGFHPVLPSLEVVYRTDPALLAAVLPPPLEAPPEPRVHARVTEIKIEIGEHTHQERVGYFAVDAVHQGELGEYPLLMPIDLEGAISISREKFGEPKKLAAIEFGREGDHVQASVTRNGVTFMEIVGDIAEVLPTPPPTPAVQWWFKYLPAVSGGGFDYGPILIRVDQVRSPQSLERVEGKLVLRDSPTDWVADLPVLETESVSWTTRTATHEPKVVGPVDADAFLPFAHARYDVFR
jgi:acetoacetate decarboxylase